MGWDMVVVVEANRDGGWHAVTELADKVREFKDPLRSGDLMEGRDSALQDVLTGEGRLSGSHERLSTEIGRKEDLSPEAREILSLYGRVSDINVADLSKVIRHQWPEDVSGWWRDLVLKEFRQLLQNHPTESFRLVAWLTP